MVLKEVFENEKPLDNLVSDGGYTAIFRTVACVGDSLSSGEFEATDKNGAHTYHDMYEYSWGQFLARMCGSKVYNFSRGGMTASAYCQSFADSQGFWDSAKAAQAYIIALGVNDISAAIGAGKNDPSKATLGTLDDVDFDDYRNNKESFAGYYAAIIQRLKTIQPRAKFFLMTIPNDPDATPERVPYIKQHYDLMYSFAEKFDNAYVLDLYKYGPKYDKDFKERFFFGHMSPAGYLLTAKMVASYIDYIIRYNPNDFKEIGFIGTDLHY